MKKFSTINRSIIIGGLSLIIIGCQTKQSNNDVETYQDIAKTSPEGQYVRPLKDGAPWWDVDVSNIPDATPTPYTGNYKKNPYTVLGKTYYPINSAVGYTSIGTASWYGTKFHGQATANGELYDLYGMTAAHKTLPLPSYVKVTNLDNGRTAILRVNDRGPFHSDRVIDLSFAAAKKLGYAETGTARVKVEGIDPIQWQKTHSTVTTVTKTATLQTAPATNTPIKEYTPPVNQHVSIPTNETNISKEGLYLQVGAFANPDAAELLRQQLLGITNTPVFITAITQGKTQLYRVRLGPIANQQEVLKTQQSVRIANLGNPTLVKQ